MSKKRHSVNLDLPGAVSAKFERQLRHLVDQLAGIHGFKGQYLRSEIFSKYLDETLVPEEMRREAGIQKWMSAEQENAKTNMRLYIHKYNYECTTWWYRDNCDPRTGLKLKGSDPIPVDERTYPSERPQLGWINYEDLVNDIRKVIYDVLGPIPYPAILQGSTFTNGASTRVRRSPGASVRKLTGELQISERAIKHWLAAFSGTRLSRQPMSIVNSSVLFTVPKKTDIDRVACKEPEGNMLLQRSVGEYIRKRLKRVGINLNDQGVNQKLAAEALKKRLATVDLSSASDSITRQLVFMLLPYDWWDLLDDLRVDSTLIDGRKHTLEMFSSMGNGFTFELETLIFYAITRVTMWRSGIKGRVSVYGDDIICPTAGVRRLRGVLAWFGFRLNDKKTHFTGVFRESCGRHYWKGLDVTPFYVRRAVRTVPELVNTLNHLLEWDGRGWGFFSTEEAYRFWKRWVNFVPKEIWGGIDPADPTALVTGHFPRKRLVPITRRVGTDQEASLTSWLHVREHVEREFSVDPRVEVGFRLSRVVALGERTTWLPGAAWEPGGVGMVLSALSEPK